MVLQTKLDAVRTLLEQHNEVVGKDKPGFIPIDPFLDAIKSAGGTSDELLKKFSHEDILDCMPGESKPKILAKVIAGIFRGADENTTTVVNKPANVSAKKAEKLTLAECVEVFDPEEPESPVGKRLAAIAGKKPFIVFTTGRFVDVKTTTKLLLQIKQNYPAQATVNVDGEIKQVYSLGELPDAYVDENPLYVGRPLLPDGSCDQTGRSWEGVSKEVRQLVRIALDMGLFSVSTDNGLEMAHSVMNKAVAVDARKNMRALWPKAAVRYDELEKLGKLPTLLVKLNGGTTASGRPFDGGEPVGQRKPKTPPQNPPIIAQNNLWMQHEKPLKKYVSNKADLLYRPEAVQHFMGVMDKLGRNYHSSQVTWRKSE